MKKGDKIGIRGPYGKKFEVSNNFSHVSIGWGWNWTCPDY